MDFDFSLDIDYGQPWRRTFGDNIAYTDWKRDNFFYAVQKLVGNRNSIGIEYDHLNLENFAKMKDWLPKAEFSDVGRPTMRMRMIKSDEEIQHITNGSNTCAFGARAAVPAIKEGVPEYEVALACTRAMIREIARLYPHAESMDSKYGPLLRNSHYNSKNIAKELQIYQPILPYLFQDDVVNFYPEPKMLEI